MNYGVHWEEDSLDQLTDLWLQADPPTRRAITGAEAQIHHALTNNPHAAGQPLSEGLYVIQVGPLRVYYEIDDATRTVEVTTVVSVP
jgi:hypothetical protein